jgi:hypothetical protein
MWQKLSNRQIGLGLAGSVLLAIAVGSGLRMITSDPEVAVEPNAAATSPPAVIPFQAGPFVPSSPQLRLADPALLRSTPKEARLQTVAAGRPDPFAPVVLGGSPRPKAAPVAAAVSAPPAAPVALPGQPLPVMPVTATQALPPLPVAIAPLPALGPIAAAPGLVPALPSLGAAGASSLSLVDRIEVSGVAQIGDRVSAIIKEPGASTSRYVRAGDAIAGGQVRVKRIDLSSGEPLVVLEYNGQEFYRSVGSTAVAGLL